MTRLIGLAVFVILIAAFFLIPAAPPGRQAAVEAGSLLSEQGLWEALLAGPATTKRDDDSVLIRIATGTVTVDGNVDTEAAEVARRSIVRGLRSLAAGDGVALEVVLSDPTTPGAIRFDTTAAGGGLRLDGHVAGFSSVSAEKNWPAPSRRSLFPPLLAIFLAILLRRPALSLFCGVLLGSVLVRIAAGSGAVRAVVGGSRDVFGTYFWEQFLRKDRYEMVLFVVFMLAMVGVITRAGGIRGVMNSIARLARDARRTQIATFAMGLAIFFDDYANTILVGSTMRPLSDHFKIAREKLAYIVDSTAAPVAGISVFSTWIAFEVSTFSAQLPDAGLTAADGYAVFFQTLPYRFYCILSLFFVALITFTGRDFGAMYRAERRARIEGKVLRDGAHPMVGRSGTDLAHAPGVTPQARIGLIPVLTFIGVALFEILRSGNGFGMGARLFTVEGMTLVLYDGSGSRPLMIGALAGLIVAGLLATFAGIARDVVPSAWAAIRSMGIALVILYLAWMIGAVCDALGTAPYLSALLHDRIPAYSLPAILLILSGLIAFATGSSWSTMTILLPLVVGLSFSLGETAALGGHMLMVMSVGAVLEGAIFGDHCSPISDTTVMSSIASASDHIDHVRTQAPYAITTLSIGLLLGYLPCAIFGLQSRPWLPFLCLSVSVATLVGILMVFGKKTETIPDL